MNIHKPLPNTALTQELERELARRVEDLFIARPPVQLDQRKAYLNWLKRHRRKVTNKILVAITSARLDKFSSGVFTSTELDIPTKRGPWDRWISLRLFCNDVESVLRTHYGDIDRIALAKTSRAVFTIVLRHSRRHANEFCMEWLNAMDLVEAMHKSFSYVDDIEAAARDIDTTRVVKAMHQNTMRARAVLESPSNFSKYTIQFAKIWLSTDPPGAS